MDRELLFLRSVLSIYADFLSFMVFKPRISTLLTLSRQFWRKFDPLIDNNTHIYHDPKRSCYNLRRSRAGGNSPPIYGLSRYLNRKSQQREMGAGVLHIRIEIEHVNVRCIVSI